MRGLLHTAGERIELTCAVPWIADVIAEGAAGVDMGRNIFQSDNPVAMIQAIRAVVHESAKPQAAYDQFLRR